MSALKVSQKVARATPRVTKKVIKLTSKGEVSDILGNLLPKVAQTLLQAPQNPKNIKDRRKAPNIVENNCFILGGFF